MLLPFLLCILILYIPPSGPEPLQAWQFSAAGVCLLALVNAAFCWAGSGLAVRLYRRAGEHVCERADIDIDVDIDIEGRGRLARPWGLC